MELEKTCRKQKVNWNDKDIFKLFIRENGDGGIWSVISEKHQLKTLNL